jgi:hypothetical protein
MIDIRIIRDKFTLSSCTGKMYVDGVYFGETLEDCSRGENVKIAGETSIPTGIYKMKLSMSARFKRLMPMIYTEPNEFELINKGISFKGIRIHGGNRAKDSHGCILIAKNRINDDLIQGSLEAELTALIKEKGGIGLVSIVNQ